MGVSSSPVLARRRDIVRNLGRSAAAPVPARLSAMVKPAHCRALALLVVKYTNALRSLETLRAHIHALRPYRRPPADLLGHGSSRLRLGHLLRQVLRQSSVPLNRLPAQENGPQRILAFRFFPRWIRKAVRLIYLPVHRLTINLLGLFPNK